MAGDAFFTPAPDGLSYAERGTLAFGDYRGEASAGYRFVFDAPGACRVEFPDGRLFHGLDLSAGVATVDHPCGADSYRGRYRAHGPDGWSVVWLVGGPRKRLRIGSRYRREPSAGSGG